MQFTAFAVSLPLPPMCCSNISFFRAIDTWRFVAASTPGFLSFSIAFVCSRVCSTFERERERERERVLPRGAAWGMLDWS